MRNNNILLVAIIAVMCVLLGVLAFSSFRDLKKMELAFNEKRAILVKDNLDLKDRLDSLQKIISEKTESLIIMEKEKETIQEQLILLKADNEKFMESYTAQLEVLNRKKEALRKRVLVLEKGPVMQRIKDALKKEENDNIRKVLEDALNKIELIKEGKSVSLEPIIVTKSAALSGEDPSAQREYVEGEGYHREGKAGTVLSVDRKNSLIVVSIGRREGVREGYKCKILKDGEAVASAEVVKVRYEIAAAFVNNIMARHSINDIKEGLQVTVSDE